MYAVSNDLTHALVSFLDFEHPAKLHAATDYGKRKIMFILDGGHKDDAKLIRAASHLERAKQAMKNSTPGDGEAFISATKAIGMAITILRESSL